MFESLEPRRLLAAAAPLDPTFGVDGRAILPFPDGRLLGLQPDGKILITRYNPSRGGNELVRLSASGAVDSSFLGGAIRDFPTGGSRINPADGRILYVTRDNAQNYSKISVLRADGTYDPSFGGGDGIVNLSDLTPTTFIDDIEWQGGKLLYLTENNQIHRLNADGSPDASFGNAGEAPFTGFNDFQIDGAGRIYFVHDARVEEGSFSQSTSRVTSEVVRLTADGDTDTTYDQDGSAVANISTTTQSGMSPTRFATGAWRVESDGTVYHTIAQGLNVPEDGPRSILLARLTPAGDLSVRKEFPAEPNAGSADVYVPVRQAGFMRAQSDGKLLLFGSVYPGFHWQVSRLNADFTPDTTYGENATAAFDQKISFDGPILLADDKLLMGGARLGIANATFEVDRYLPTGPEVATPTVTLNAKGTLIATTSASSEIVSLAIRQRDGRMVLRVGNFAQSFAPSKVKRIALFLGGGNDTLTVGAGIKGVYCEGGDGNDTLNGGQGGDVLLGGLGGDQLFGNDGDDTLLGEGGNDYLFGGAGKDDLFGNGGVDTLSGAGGNDRLFGGPNDADLVKGGAGTDSAAASDEDEFDSIETLLS